MNNSELFEELKKDYSEKTTCYLKKLETYSFSDLFDPAKQKEMTSCRLDATIIGARLTYFIVTMKSPNET